MRAIPAQLRRTFTAKPFSGVRAPLRAWALSAVVLGLALAVVVASQDAVRATAHCANGTVVPNPSGNPGLVVDCETLLSLKDELAGTATLDWSENRAITYWEGITFGGTPHRVTGVGLNSKNLTGTIPAELGDLTNLTELYLHDNRLSDPIPPELGDLSNLIHLNLWNNRLSGPIPTELGDLSNLTVLDLRSNQLSGPIPTELGDFSSLTFLGLSNNQLSGDIPPELGNLPNLTLLDLSGNQLNGPIPTELGDLSNLIRLGLRSNQLSGPIPTELGDLSNLTVLDLRSNQLSGPIPTELGDLSNLTVLDLRSNQLSGPIPTELGDLSNLTVLDLRSNQLSGPIPTELGDLSNLTVLDLRSNQLSGPIPTELGDLSNLTVLDLRSNQLSGPIPTELGDFSSLTFLGLSNNQLSGDIPPELGNLPNLTLLDLSGNQLNGPIPTELGDLSNLIRLGLRNNQLSGPIPTELGDLSSLISLVLSDNQLSGAVPPELEDLSNLTQLFLSNNQLSGGIPPELVNLTKLERLWVYDNHLTAPVWADGTELNSLIMSYPENGAEAVARFGAAGLTGGTITWSLSGADTDDLTISSEGVLTFDQPPNYEAPTGGQNPDGSSGTSNEYSVTVTASDGVSSRTFDVNVQVQDLAISLSASPASVGESDEATAITVTATVTGGPSGVSVTISALSGSASPGDDYTTAEELPITITIPANQLSATTTLTITPLEDNDIEGDETIVITGEGTGITVTDAVVTITDDDLPTLSLTPSSTTVSEGENAAFTVTLSKAVADDVTVDWSVDAGGAAASTDYGASSGSVTLEAGSLTQTFAILIEDDLLSEAAETFSVSLGAVTSGVSDPITVDTSASSVTIAESDPITVTLHGDSAIVEGGSAAYTVTLSPSDVIRTENIEVRFATSHGTAGSGDYTAESRTLTFPSDALERQVTVQTTEDGSVEGNETFTITLSNPTGGEGEAAPVLGSPSSIAITITDDDTPPSGEDDPPSNRSPRFTEGTSATRSVAENAPVGTEVGEPVRARDSDGDSLRYSLLSVEDHESFNVDRDTGQITTDTELNYEVKAEYSLRMRVWDGRGGRDFINVAIAVTDVTDVSLSASPASVGEGDGTASITVTAALDDGVLEDPITVPLAIGSGSAVSGDDYTTAGELPAVIIPAGQTSARATLSVTLVDDDIVEGDESIVITSESPDVEVSQPAVVTITDDEVTPTPGPTTPTPTPDPTAPTPTPKPGAAGTPAVAPTPASESTDDAPASGPETSEGDAGGGGFPWWIIAVSVIGIVSGIAFTVWVRRRRRI